MPLPSARGLAAALLVLLLPLVAADATTYLLETSRLELPGGWETSLQNTPAVRRLLQAGASAPGAPAAGAVRIPHGGTWRLWVRSKDFPADRPGTRHFSVRLGEKRSPVEFGRHGQAALEGWAWEDGGAFELPAGPVLVVLGDSVASVARCDALVLTDNLSYRPEGVPWKLSKEPAQLVPLEYTPTSLRAILPAPLEKVEETPAAALENEKLQLRFLPATTAEGAVLALRAATRGQHGWEPLPGAEEAEGYRVLARPRDSDPKIGPGLNPIWDIGFSPVVEARCGATSVRTRLGLLTAPWCSARCRAPRPTAATQVDAQTVELTFPPLPEGTLTARWHLAPGAAEAEVTLRLQPTAPGHYSLGYHAPLASAPEATDFLLLPFQYQAHRFPDAPAMLLSALTPTPLALVTRGAVSCALVAEPGALSPDWPDSTNSRFMLGLRNESGQAQPLIYSPVLGQAGSISQGEPVEARFRLLLQRGEWYAAYRHVADDIYGLRDYRRPVAGSLSDAALNLLDLLRNEEASGWSAKAKGPWNIESRNTVSHSSPLTYLSLYLLTGDEEFYRRRARPALEYLLSRPSPHFAAEREIWENYYTHQPLRGPAPYSGAATFASAWQLTHGRTPAFAELARDEKGAARIGHGGGHTQSFADPLALYTATHERRWLDEAVRLADQYLAANLTTLPSKDLGPSPFINVSFVPDWEGLLHLYEATGERRFLTAATEGAHWLQTSLWTQPLIRAGETTIHPGGVYDANRHIWWFGDELFRRGIYRAPASWETPYPPPTKLPEKRVPAWEVSQVGLGLEQPSTYNRRGPKANILMSVWAPSLLRLSGPAGDPTLRTAARNAFIGRFTSYPGYYLDGRTTEYQRPDYPITGPDVTSLYVHHIPPFAAGVLDYLFTDAETRSAGEIRFPSVRQCGYVWFDSRLYGHAPGQVYGQSAWPWLHRTAATVDNINIDRLLAEGEGRLHAVLMNQVNEAQRVTVTFDPSALGCSVEDTQATVIAQGRPAGVVPIRHGQAALTLPPQGITVLTLSGTHIDVPTHRQPPPERLTLPTAPAIRRVALPGTALEAIGTELLVPPFTTRDLYVYLTAGIDDCRHACLIYRVGGGPEQRVEGTGFPWEFTVSLPADAAPVTWRMEAD